VKPSFVIFDIRALWRSALSVRVPVCQKLQMARDALAVPMATADVKGLTSILTTYACSCVYVNYNMLTFVTLWYFISSVAVTCHIGSKL